MNVVRNSAKNEPLLVHCSAGVGRTGTFIILDYIINLRANKETPPTIREVNNLILNLRRQRNIHMVQAPEQYKFIFEVLRDYYKELERQKQQQAQELRQAQASKSVEFSSGMLEKPSVYGTTQTAAKTQAKSRRLGTSRKYLSSNHTKPKPNDFFPDNNPYGSTGSAKDNIKLVIGTIAIYLEDEIRFIKADEETKDKLEKTLKKTSKKQKDESEWKIPKYLSFVSDFIKDEVLKSNITNTYYSDYGFFINIIEIFQSTIEKLESLSAIAM